MYGENMAISTKPAISNSPPQAPFQRLPASRERGLLSIGIHRSQAATVGPARQEPRENLAAQSSRSNASYEPQRINRAELTSRTIDRASIEQPSAYSDYPAASVEVP
jgi:hypothetical protein